MRINRYLARAGIASRRMSEDLIRDGRVTINGEVNTDLSTRVGKGDVVEFDGRRVELVEEHSYLVLNKPTGYVTTMSDPHNRKTTADLIPLEKYEGIFSVGRLDLDTTGVLIFTSDGELGHKLLHPSFEVTKTYIARLDKPILENHLLALRSGIELDDGLTAPAEAKKIGEQTVSLKIKEGRKRQVRRMFSHIGLHVDRLDRPEFAGINYKGLKLGEFRELSASEVFKLKKLVGMK